MMTKLLNIYYPKVSTEVLTRGSKYNIVLFVQMFF